MTLTVAFITARQEPEFRWLFDSVRRESDCPIMVISENFVSALHESVSFHRPKPSVWSGPHRVTKQDWWSKSNALNTAICLCETEWLMLVDDRSVLLPGWFSRVKAAMDGGYAVCGKYEKTHNLIVTNGEVESYVEPTDDDGNKTGKDARIKEASSSLVGAPWDWWYGCLNALPLEWALSVNGFDETCDGLSGEDTIFGAHLTNSGYPLKYDTQFALIEDRTPGKLGPHMKRENKGVGTADKSHALLAKLCGLKQADHTIDLRKIRRELQEGGDFPVADWPVFDWYDGAPIDEL